MRASEAVESILLCAHSKDFFSQRQRRTLWKTRGDMSGGRRCDCFQVVAMVRGCIVARGAMTCVPKRMLKACAKPTSITKKRSTKAERSCGYLESQDAFPCHRIVHTIFSDIKDAS